MRILIDALGTPGWGGGSTRVHELARGLPAQGPQHHFTFLVRPQVKAMLGQDGPAELLSPCARLSDSPARAAWQVTRLPYWARQLRPDVVLSLFNVLAPHWPASRPGLAVMVSNLGPLSRRRVPMRAMPRELALRRLTLASVRRADLVLLQSRSAGESFGLARAARRTVVIPHRSPLPAEVEPADGLAPEGPFFAVIADQYRHKSLETVIRALGRIDAGLRPRVVFVGERPDPSYSAELDALIRASGVEESVVQLGPQPHARALGVLDRALACIAPSRLENLSRIPFEAAALGTPLIASDIPAHREAAGPAAMYYPHADADALADAMSLVLRDDDTRRRLAEAAASSRRRAGEAQPIAALVTALESLAA